MGKARKLESDFQRRDAKPQRSLCGAAHNFLPASHKRIFVAFPSAAWFIEESIHRLGMAAG
jgi:hypothetical protein